MTNPSSEHREVLAKTTTDQTTTLHSLLDGRSLAQGLEVLEGRIRKQPDIIHHRLLTFDLLCLLGQWQRALGQLQLCARLDASRIPEAYVYKDLIESELFRAEVFAGQRTPLLEPDTVPWLRDQIQALALQAQGQISKADALREHALDQASEVNGQVTLGTHGKEEKLSFQWITDSDTRIGPALEMFAAGQYRWIAFSSVARFRLAAPLAPRDLIWQPLCVTTYDAEGNEGQEMAGFLPARYPGSEAASDPLRLGQMTTWDSIGNTAVLGLGQKVWSTDQRDLAAYDLRECVLASPAVQENSTGTQENSTGTQEDSLKARS